MSILQTKGKDGSISMLIAGKVSNPPAMRENNRGGKVIFSVNFGKNLFMQCDVWSDRAEAYDLAGRLEKGDAVAVMGIYAPYEWKGETKPCMNVDFIFTMAMPTAPTVNFTPASAPVNVTAEDFEELDDSEELPF